MRVRVGCEFLYELAASTPMLFIVRPREQDLHRLLDETRTIEPELPLHDFVDGFGNRVWRLTAPAGELRLRYDALAEVPPTPDPLCAHLPATPIDELPDDTLVYTLPSRYCPSDLMADDAVRLFATTPDGGARVQAICDWTHANIAYQAGSTSTTSGYEAYQQRQGVCRDFAHVAIIFCRALNIPARYVCGYLPDIGVPPDPTPMDFHAWFEAYVGGAWRTFDARHNIPRIGRVVIARGRDAVDAALTTSYGISQLIRMEVWADEVAASFPLTPLPPAPRMAPPGR